MSASEASKEDRELPASERRIERAREEGQVPRSRDVVHAAAALSLVLLAAVAGPWMGEQALGLVASGLRFDQQAALDSSRMVPRLVNLSAAGLLWLVPALAALGVLLAVATVAVGGWNLSTQALAPKLDRLDPMAGFGRLVDWRGMLMQLRLALLAAALLVAAGWYLLRHGDAVAGLSAVSLRGGLALGFGWLGAGALVLLAVCVVSALADVPLQLFKHKADLRMTRDEARQEHKEAEGDPHVKGERRRRQRAMSRGRMLAAVPAASVVVTNPTHYAVALRYDESTMGAPRIVALGADHLALKIREVAAAAGVPVLESPPLARALYKHGDLDAEVPVQLYTAVAQVLAWVMRLRDAVRPPPLPQVQVPAGMDPLEGQA